MFEGLKKFVSEAAQAAANQGPPDLAAVPTLPQNRQRDLAAFDPSLVGAYLGLTVASIAAMGPLGPEASTFIGAKIQERLRAAGGGLEPGEIVAGQNAAREARMRAQGMSEEQVALIRDQIAQATSEHARDGWTIQFVNGTAASVQLFPREEDGEFARMRSTYASQHTRSGVQAMQDSLGFERVMTVRDAPYETYYVGGVLTAANDAFEAVAKANHLKTGHFHEVLAGLAAIALRMREG